MRRALIMSALLLFSGCVNTGPSPELLATASRISLSAQQKSQIAKVVANNLKDPDAAKFRWYKLIDIQTKPSVYNFCSQVNGKNSYGGYVGYKYFYVVIRMEKDGSIPFAQLIGMDSGDGSVTQDVCEQKGYTGIPTDD